MEGYLLRFIVVSVLQASPMKLLFVHRVKPYRPSHLLYSAFVFFADDTASDAVATVLDPVIVPTQPAQGKRVGLEFALSSL